MPETIILLKETKMRVGYLTSGGDSDSLMNLTTYNDEELVMGETNFDLDKEYGEDDIFKIPGNRGKQRNVDANG